MATSTMGQIARPVSVNWLLLFDKLLGFYSNNWAISGVELAQGMAIVWESDGTVQGDGWEICALGPDDQVHFSL